MHINMDSIKFLSVCRPNEIILVLVVGYYATVITSPALSITINYNDLSQKLLHYTPVDHKIIGQNNHGFTAVNPVCSIKADVTNRIYLDQGAVEASGKLHVAPKAVQYLDLKIEVMNAQKRPVFVYGAILGNETDDLSQSYRGADQATILLQGRKTFNASALRNLNFETIESALKLKASVVGQCKVSGRDVSALINWKYKYYINDHKVEYLP